MPTPVRNPHVYDFCSVRRLHAPACPTSAALRNEVFVKNLRLERALDAHGGCVNTVSWSSNGEVLVSSGDDCELCLWGLSDGLRLKKKIKTGHCGNVFCAKFVPFTNDQNIISCAYDGDIRMTDASSDLVAVLASYSRSVHKLAFIPDAPRLFLSVGDDGTVRLFDLRTDTKTTHDTGSAVNVVANFGSMCGLNSLAIHPAHSHLMVVGGDSPFVYMFDLRRPAPSAQQTLESPLTLQCLLKLVPMSDVNQQAHITGVAFNYNGTKIAATYSQGTICVFDTVIPEESRTLSTAMPEHSLDNEESRGVPPHWMNLKYGKAALGVRETPEEAGPTRSERLRSPFFALGRSKVPSPVSKAPEIPMNERELSGHSNRRTIKEVTFYGAKSDWVMSGSDTQQIFVWNVRTGEVVKILEDADQMTVNCIAPNPQLPAVIATCGIDTTVKIWSPSRQDSPAVAPSRSRQLFTRNRINIPEDIREVVEQLIAQGHMNMARCLIISRLVNGESNDDEDDDEDDDDDESETESEETEEDEEMLTSDTPNDSQLSEPGVGQSNHLEQQSPIIEDDVKMEDVGDYEID